MVFEMVYWDFNADNEKLAIYPTETEAFKWFHIKWREGQPEGYPRLSVWG